MLFRVVLTSVTVTSTVYVWEAAVAPTLTTSDDEMQEVKGSARSCSNLRWATVMAPARIAAAELYFMAYTQSGTMPVRTIRNSTSAIHVSSRVNPRFACCFVCVLMQPALY